MLYQTLKFYLARIAVSLILIFGLGYTVLFFLHEVALPNVLFDDVAIQWAIVLVCLFFGFIAYGMVGDQRFFNVLHFLKGVSPRSEPEDIKNQFENLLSFTYSSYFLPDTGKQYRILGVLLYADYLLSIGDETPRALNIYVQAFLQSPKDSRFRKPLLAILNQGRELTQEEMDLLLIMFQQEEIHDPTLTHYLASLFLKAGQWSGKVESLFLSTLENQSELSDDIIQFALPIYLSHKRTDELALRFYLFALNFSVKEKEEEQIKHYLARSYCEGNLSGVAPHLHQKCGEIFSGMSPDQQEEIKRQSEENQISSKMKKVKLFRREDLQDLKRLKVEMGLVASRMTVLGRVGRWLVGKILSGFKWILLQVLEGLIRFGHLSLRAKLVSFSVVSVSIILVLGFSELTYNNNQPPAYLTSILGSKTSQAKKEDRVYTIQISAVISAKQADQLIRNLKKRGVEGLYVVKAIRRSGGHWYKIQAGQFSSKNQASAYANRLVDSNSIKNYFLISLPKK